MIPKFRLPVKHNPSGERRVCSLDCELFSEPLPCAWGEFKDPVRR
ncbi:hypothetical protein GEOBRER4_n3221 [Citrifermentans bremense]|uniref:Uncharacterized protein n=1 Tax=Citrifermentans bremense TaxID=60035 RepID=A0A7R7FSH2_9BACT|nr:hypothetical protein GEOBRER4_n3221 [Citrifermentans bremense]